jgi:hypothetical protein
MEDTKPPILLLHKQRCYLPASNYIRPPRSRRATDSRRRPPPPSLDEDNNTTSPPVIVAAGPPSSLVDCCDLLPFVVMGVFDLPSCPFLSSLSHCAPPTFPMLITDH